MKVLKKILIIIILILVLVLIYVIGLNNNWFNKTKTKKVTPGTILCTKKIQDKETDILGIEYSIYFYYNENNKVTKINFETLYDFKDEMLAKENYVELEDSNKYGKNISINKNIVKYWEITKIKDDNLYDKDKKIDAQKKDGYACDNYTEKATNN